MRVGHFHRRGLRIHEAGESGSYALDSLDVDADGEALASVVLFGVEGDRDGVSLLESGRWGSDAEGGEDEGKCEGEGLHCGD